MTHHKFVISVLFLSVALVAGAQTNDHSAHYNVRLQQFLQQQQRDSFLHYTTLKAAAYKANNQLADWAWTQLDASDFLADNLHDAPAALQWLEQNAAARWREPVNADEWEPFCYWYSNQGWYLLQQGKLVQAATWLQLAARQFEQYQYPDFDALETIYKPLGNVYTRLGDNDKALVVFQKALQWGGDAENMAGLYCNVGITCWNKGDLAASEQYHRKGLALRGISRLKRALLLGALAQTQLDQQQPALALQQARASLQLLTAEKPEGRALEYRSLSRRIAGIACLRLGQIAAAREWLQTARTETRQAFGAHSRELAKVDIAIARLWLEQQNAGAAMTAANEALKAVLPGFQPKSITDNPDAAIFYEENTIFEALTAKATAAQLQYTQTRQVAWLELALRCHDLAWQAENRLRNIFQYNTSKLDLQTDTRVRETAAMSVVRLLYEKTGSPQYLYKAFELAERSKAALLRDALRDNLIHRQRAVGDTRFEALAALRQQLSWYEKQLLLESASPLAGQWRHEADQLLNNIRAAEAALRRDYPALSAQETPDYATIAAQLDQDEVLLSYFWGAETISLFVFPQQGAASWHEIPNTADFQALTSRFLNYFDHQQAILNDPNGYLLVAHQLWKTLLPASTTGYRQYTIIADGLLHAIPFDALVTAPPGSETTLRNAAYLVREVSVRYAWSYGVLRQQADLRSPATRLALGVAPGFAPGMRGLSPLPVAAAEMPPGSVHLWYEQADVAHFMQAVGQYRIVHLSTHAFATTSGGQIPRLELYDQPLFLPSIYALPLQAELVTLSACQTGVGQERSGEGVMSLARAFAQAGAACVVSSLWAVNDRATSRLLSGFYEKLAGGMPVAQSLQAAKLAYLNDVSIRGADQTPYGWAGLTLVGDNRVIVANSGYGVWLWVVLAVAAVLGGLWWRKNRRSWLM